MAMDWAVRMLLRVVMCTTFNGSWSSYLGSCCDMLYAYKIKARHFKPCSTKPDSSAPYSVVPLTCG